MARMVSLQAWRSHRRGQIYPEMRRIAQFPDSRTSSQRNSPWWERGNRSIALKTRGNLPSWCFPGNDNENDLIFLFLLKIKFYFDFLVLFKTLRELQFLLVWLVEQLSSCEYDSSRQRLRRKRPEEKVRKLRTVGQFSLPP